MSKSFFLYKLTRIVGDGDPIYDCCNGFIVGAPDVTTARLLVADRAGDEGRDVWIKAHLSKAEIIGRPMPVTHGDLVQPYILMTDFHNG